MLVVTTLLASLYLGAGRQPMITYKNLALYPISSGLSNRAADVITLDEGVKQGTVVITETGTQPPLVRSHPGAGAGVRNQAVQQAGSAQVNTLWLTNTSGKTLLLIAGEMVVGGRQDRIIQKDGLIRPSKQPVDLAVFCVEHGRWTPQSAKFGTAINGAMGGAGGGFGGAVVAPSVRGKAVVAQDQGAVWNSVAGQTATVGASTNTGTYREVYANPKTSSRIEDYVRAIDARFPANGAAGVVVSINGKLVWMDRFDSRQTFKKYWPKLLKSYALESMSQPDVDSKNPSYADAMHFADSREGKTSFEGEEGLSKLTKVETATAVLYELEDLQTNPGMVLHANKVSKT